MEFLFSFGLTCYEPFVPLGPSIARYVDPMKSIKLVALLVLSLGLARTASAIPYYLATDDATTVTPGNTTSSFYDVDVKNGGIESGTATNLFSSTFGGDDV